MTNDSRYSELGDAELVGEVAQGDRAAFKLLVERHQSAVCGVAYSVCGDFAGSEDIAQEAFVAAWKQLADLRDRSHFRSWVCGIARKRALQHVTAAQRRERRETVAQETGVADALDVSPFDAAVAEEEKALLWKALARLPETYRETLVLYYREHQSLSAVAEALDLSEDATKQRLSRGREMLRAEVERLIVSVLGNTRPGVLFTLAVMTALPPALGAAVAGLGAAKTAGALLGGASLASGAVGLLGLYTSYKVWRALWLPAEAKRVVRRLFLSVFAAALLFAAFLTWLGLTGGKPLERLGLQPGSCLVGVVLTYLLANLLLALTAARTLSRLLRSANANFEWARKNAKLTDIGRCRYRSGFRLLGLPLVDLAFGPNVEAGEKSGTAKGWIALGDVALGGLFAFGGFAAAPVSVGGLTLGLVSLGGATLGLLALGGIAVGMQAFGGIALAHGFAAGGLALSFWGAAGGCAAAGVWALGGVAFAPHANDLWAREAAGALPYAKTLFFLAPYAGWLSLLSVPALLLVLRKLRRHERGASDGA